MTTLDEALALRACGSGEWNAHADPRYEANNGMFGGWTAALLLKSALDDARTEGTPSALTVHYLKQVRPGSDVTVRTRRVGGGRSLELWQAELAPAGDDDAAALATIVLANRRETDGFIEPTMPSVPDPDTLPVFHPPGPFGERTLVWPVMGYPPFNQPHTRSIGWVRETSGRAIDHAQLAYLSDGYPPRIFFTSAGPRVSSTITLSVYFHATEREVHELGDDYVLMEATGTRAESSTAGQQARLWSRKGQLLATTEQLHWFK
jgi:acyl-CoA thioesterase